MSRYWTVWSAALLFFAAFYAFLVPIPLCLEAVGLPDWQIGLVLGAFGVASLVGRPLMGAISDSLGSRPVILFGTVALAAGATLMSFTSSPVLLFGLRVLQAAGYVTFTTAANVAITLTPAAVSAGLATCSPHSSAARPPPVLPGVRKRSRMPVPAMFRARSGAAASATAHFF